MATKTALTVRLHIAGVRDTLDAFRELPKDANEELRGRSLRIAEVLADKVRAAARAEGSQAALLARTVKAVRDRVPAVQAGGTTKLGRHNAPAYALLFGSEFGMNRRSGWYAGPEYRRSDGYQYHRHTGQEGAWFFPTVEGEQDWVSRQWHQAADAIVRRFAEGGG